MELFRDILLLYLLTRLFHFVVIIRANEIIGCGGFIKCHTNIDFSKIEVKLLTKQGVLKDKTDCSPSNGYYFLPIYDKGDYVLRVAPPHGWSFEPEEVKLNFDGKTDMCSQGKDVNFIFKGFGITGKIIFADRKGIICGAEGVNVILKHSIDKNFIDRTTLTDSQGVFSFTPIIPGNYVLKVHKDNWHFKKAEHVVEVKEGNTDLPIDALVVSGFDVKGSIDTINELPSGIWVVLYCDKQAKEIDGMCDPKNDHFTCEVKQTVVEYKSKPYKYTKVNSLGDYVFHDIAPGKYLLMPLSENRALRLHWEPEYKELEVIKDFVEVETKFKVIGFSVNGKVLRKSKGPPIPKAIVKLNGGKIIAETDVDGIFTLSRIPSPGMYTIQVEAPQLKFPTLKIHLEITKNTLPPIVPIEYEVCGSVNSRNSFKVSIIGKDIQPQQNVRKTVRTNPETGAWCTYLPTGEYIISVLTSDIDKNNAIQFYPLSQVIEVKWDPLKNITFSQLRATVKGSLKCLPDAPINLCLETEISLMNLDNNSDRLDQTKMTKAKDGFYIFENVLPGRYEVTIPRYNLCFYATQFKINVQSVAETVPTFQQTGYEINIISSHRTMLKYYHTLMPNSKTAKQLLSGVNTFCVETYGTYNIQLEGCHSYDTESTAESFSTVDTSSIIINAIAHKVGTRFLVTKDLSTADFQLYVESPSVGKQWVKPKVETNFIDSKMIAYRFETQLQLDEILHITPHSELLLFEPATTTIVGTNDCVDVAFTFHASRGIILHGKTEPSVKDAKITLTFPQNPPLKQQTVLTSDDGTFKFSAFPNNLQYELSGEKESYVFSKYNWTTSTFYVQKLCEVTVYVQDEEGKPLRGVLISISGGESYRKNLMTSEHGRITFHSLAPSQYFIKPLMKEFKFEPNSKIIELKNGEAAELHMIGKKVAYSVFGTVRSLNGEPYSQLNIEANSNEICSLHQEETNSEFNGQYRLRGLQPGCNYTITIKSNNDNPRTTLDHSIPAQHYVAIVKEDIHNVDYTAVPPLTYTDVVVRVTASTNDFYKTLNLCMYQRGSYDSPIYLQRLETPLKPKSNFNPGIMVFLPRIPLDGKTLYVAELRTTLSDSTYKYTLPYKQFVPDTGTIFIELNFTPEVRSTDADLNQNSMSALILVAIVTIVYFKQDIAMSIFDFTWSRLSYIVDKLLSHHSKSSNNNKNNMRKAEVTINQKEIEQMAEQINAIKKKKTKKI